MAVQLYGTKASRNLIRAEVKMLKHVEPVQVLGKFGVQKPQPLNKTDTTVFRRVMPFGGSAGASVLGAEIPVVTAANFVTSEGTTPTAHTMTYVDVTAVLQQYAVLFKFSSKADLLYEDDIPGDMAKLTGETLAEVAELVCYGEVKAGTNVIYSNGSSRVDIDSVISLNKLRAAARSMENNRARKVTTAIKAGPDFGTAPVEETYLVFHHTDVTADIRDIAGFTKRVEYGSAVKPVHPREIGAVEEFRFIPSPLFTPFANAATSGAVSGLMSTGGTYPDVYPVLIMAADAWGHVSLKGHGYSGISPTIIPASVKNHANPSGMFGFVGADFWYTSVRLNENHMVRVECAATSI